MNKNGEVICIHLGQAGVQMGQAAWELLAAEHQIRADGTKRESVFEEGSFTTFFQETPSGQYVPRSLFIDLEPTVIDEIRVGAFGRIFHPDLMVSGMEDSGSNYARARYTRGMHVIPLLIDKIRYVAESCDALQGFMLFSSYGGGTGSGLGALFLNRLEHEFHRRPRIHVGIFPGPELSPVVVEPYNSVLFASDLLEQADFSILLDNTALCHVIQTCLGIHKPTYTHLNRISAQIISHLTSTLRFPNTLNNSLHEMQVNLIPYPQIKFPVSSFSPIQCLDRCRHDTMGTDALTRSVFCSDNLMVSCNLHKGLFMANSMIYRGSFDPISVNQAIMCIKRECHWVTWCPTGFKIGLSNQKPMFMNSSLLAPSDRSVFMISNTTAIRQVLHKLRRKCCLMYTKQAFVHHYLNEGLEEDEMKLAYEEVSKLEGLYKEIQALDHDGSFKHGECTDDSYYDPFRSEEKEAPKSQTDPASKGSGEQVIVSKSEPIVSAAQSASYVSHEESQKQDTSHQIAKSIQDISERTEDEKNMTFDTGGKETEDTEPGNSGTQDVASSIPISDAENNSHFILDRDNNNIGSLSLGAQSTDLSWCSETTSQAQNSNLRRSSKFRFVKKLKDHLLKLVKW